MIIYSKKFTNRRKTNKYVVFLPDPGTWHLQKPKHRQRQSRVHTTLWDNLVEYFLEWGKPPASSTTFARGQFQQLEWSSWSVYVTVQGTLGRTSQTELSNWLSQTALPCCQSNSAHICNFVTMKKDEWMNEYSPFNQSGHLSVI